MDKHDEGGNKMGREVIISIPKGQEIPKTPIVINVRGGQQDLVDHSCDLAVMLLLTEQEDNQKVRSIIEGLYSTDRAAAIILAMFKLQNKLVDTTHDICTEQEFSEFMDYIDNQMQSIALEDTAHDCSSCEHKDDCEDYEGGKEDVN